MNSNLRPPKMVSNRGIVHSPNGKCSTTYLSKVTCFIYALYVCVHAPQLDMLPLDSMHLCQFLFEPGAGETKGFRRALTKSDLGFAQRLAQPPPPKLFNREAYENSETCIRILKLEVLARLLWPQLRYLQAFSIRHSLWKF